jgi:hypothetical protein
MITLIEYPEAKHKNKAKSQTIPNWKLKMKYLLNELFRYFIPIN